MKITKKDILSFKKMSGDSPKMPGKGDVPITSIVPKSS